MTIVLDKNTGPSEQQTASILTTMMALLTTSVFNDEDSFIFNTVTIQSSLKQLIALRYFIAVTVKAQITNQLQKLHSNKMYKIPEKIPESILIQRQYAIKSARVNFGNTV